MEAGWVKEIALRNLSIRNLILENQRHLLRALGGERSGETPQTGGTRPHPAMDQAAPLRSYPKTESAKSRERTAGWDITPEARPGF